MDAGRGRARRGVGTAHRDQPRARRRVRPSDGRRPAGTTATTISGPWSDAPPSTPAVPVAKAPETPAGRRSRRRRRLPRRSRRARSSTPSSPSITDDESPLTSSGLPRRRAADKPANGELPPPTCCRRARSTCPAPSPLPRRNASGARSFSTTPVLGRPVDGTRVEPIARGDPLLALELSQRPHPRSPERRTQVPHQWFSERR